MYGIVFVLIGTGACPRQVFAKWLEAEQGDLPDVSRPSRLILLMGKTQQQETCHFTASPGKVKLQYCVFALTAAVEENHKHKRHFGACAGRGDISKHVTSQHPWEREVPALSVTVAAVRETHKHQCYWKNRSSFLYTISKCQRSAMRPCQNLREIKSIVGFPVPRNILFAIVPNHCWVELHF